MRKLCFILSILFVSSSFAGNGTERGAGDEIVAEWRDVERSVKATLETLMRDGLIAETPSVRALFEKGESIRVFRVDELPNEMARAYSPRPGMLIDQNRIVFTREMWTLEKKMATRAELESSVLRFELKALGVEDEKLVDLYRYESRDFESWINQKNEARQVALGEYRKASQALESGRMARITARVKALLTHSDFANCLAPRAKRREAACARAIEFFKQSAKLKSWVDTGQENGRDSEETPRSAWLSDQLALYRHGVRASVSKISAPLLQLQTGFESECLSVAKASDQVACLSTLVSGLHARGKTAQAEALVDLDTAFQEFSSALASRVKSGQ